MSSRIATETAKKQKIQGGGVTPKYLSQNNDKYDAVLVTTENPKEVVCDLIEHLSVPLGKICAYAAEKFQTDKSLRQFLERGEDLMCAFIAKVLYGNVASVRYLEIGCNHPVTINNTALLYRYGARGVLVDPLTEMKYLTHLYRPNDKFIETAVLGKEPVGGKVMFYRCKESSGVSSLSEKWVKSFKGERTIEKIEVPAVSIEKLLEQVGFMPQFVLIDAEGEDLNIVNGIDYNKHRPDVIMAELGTAEIDEVMAERGYVNIFANRVNQLFVEKAKYELLKMYF